MVLIYIQAFMRSIPCRVLFSAWICLTANSELVCQSEWVRHYTATDGMPTRTIYRITEDHRGVLWLATKAGITSYDGSHFTNYTASHGLQENEVLNIQYLQSGENISFSYINRYNYYKNNRFFSLENYLKDSKLKDAFFSTASEFDAPRFISSGTICLINKQGSIHWNKNNVYAINKRELLDIHERYGIPRHFYIHNSFVFNKTQLIFLGIDTTLGDRSTLFWHASGRTRTFPSCTTILDIKEIIGHHMIVKRSLNELDLYTIDTMTMTIRYDRSVHLRQGFTKIIAIDSQIVVINSHGQSMVYDINFEHEIHDNIFSKLRRISDIYMGLNHNIWVSTLNDGLYQIRKSNMTHINQSKGLSGSSVHAIYPYGSNRVIVGDERGYLYVYDSHRLLKKISPPRLSTSRESNPVREIVPYDKEHIAVMYEAGLIVYDKNLSPRYHDLNPYSNKSISIGNQGELYMGTSSNLYKISPKTNELKSLLKTKITSLCMSLQGDAIWYATSDNLCRLSLKDHTVVSYSEKYPILKSCISKMCISKDGVLWIGTASKGIIGIKSDTIWCHITEKDGLLNSPINCLWADSSSILWAGTSRGLFKIQCQKQPETKKIFSVTHYSTNSGLPDNEILSIAKRMGHLYIGSNHGLAIVKEKDLITRHRINTHIVSVMINHKASDIQNHYILNPRQNTLTIHYVGVDYSHIQNLRYAYRIKGLGDQWIITTESTIDVGPLTHGSYSFEVMCVDNQGVSLGTKATIRIEVLPFFYQTAWFQILLSLVVIFLFAWYLRYFKKKEKEKNKALVHIAELEMQAVRAQINPHFIFNCLNSIQNFVNQQDIVSANKYIAKFSKLIRQTLEYSRCSSICLDEEITYIENYLKLEKMRFQDKFDYEIVKDGEISYNTVQIPSMILQPYVENAIRHGLRYLQDKKGFVSIRFVREPKNIICSIEDNGIGRKMSAELKKGSSIEYQSRGMELNKKRIDTYNLINNETIEIEFIDKEDLSTNDAGTLIKIKIPYKK